MLSGYNPYMSAYPYSTYSMVNPSCMQCPYMMHGWQMPMYTETGKEDEKEKDTRQPPFVPRPPFYGPRPPFIPRPPFVPGPFIPPYPVLYPYPRPYGTLPFLTGLALGGLLF
jgi:hypothetical protein